MRMKLVTSVILGLVAVLIVSGCVVRGRPGFSMGATFPLITISPPAPRYEVIGVPPRSGYFWVNGYWEWRGNGYVWHPGYWERGRSGYRWVPNSWRHEGRGWRLHTGYWQRY